MNKSYKKWIWGGLGGALIGPIGGILGFAIGSLSQDTQGHYRNTQTRGGDFLSAILILFSAVMKADGVQKKSELDYIKRFLVQQVGLSNTRQLLQVFKNILKQEFSLEDVCQQIKIQMDKPSILQLIHILFGLSQSDGDVHVDEVRVIKKIAGLLGVTGIEYDSIQGMVKEDLESAYNVLGVSSDSLDQEVKKAYRKMANKYHPDKIAHLGDEFKEIAQEKFNSVSEAYQKIKKDRDIK